MAKQEYMDLGALNKAIESAIRKSVSLDADLQRIGLSALNHLSLHGDIGPINRVLTALGKGTRKASLAQWFLNHGALAKNEDEATKGEKPFVYDKKRVTNMEAAHEQHWTEAKKPEELADVFDVNKALWSLIARAKKAGKVSNKELFAALEAIAPAK
jgi:hypothetical protein